MQLVRITLFAMCVQGLDCEAVAAAVHRQLAADCKHRGPEPRGRPPARRTECALSRTKLHAVIEYIEEHLDTQLTLAHMAKTVHTSPYHFARQFKSATGMPPHRYVVARRVERAQQLLRRDDLSIGEIALGAGFSDQSQLSTHFKRVVGVTPSQFRKSARIT